MKLWCEWHAPNVLSTPPLSATTEPHRQRWRRQAALAAQAGGHAAAEDQGHGGAGRTGVGQRGACLHIQGPRCICSASHTFMGALVKDA